MNKRFIQLTTLVLIFTSRMYAAESDSITFVKAIDIIVKNNYAIKAAEVEVKASAEGISIAEVKPAPEMDISLDMFGYYGAEVALSHTYELGGKRKKRIQSAKYSVESSENARILTQKELTAEAIRRFIMIEDVKEKLLVLDSLTFSAEAGIKEIARRITAGGTRKTDLLNAEIELGRFMIEKNSLLSTIKLARARFAVLGGDNSESLLNAIGKVDKILPAPPLDELIISAENSEVMKNYDIDLKLLSAEIEQIKAESVPDLTLTAGIVTDNREFSCSPFIGASFTLPGFIKKGPEIKKSELTFESVKIKQKNDLIELNSEIEALYSNIQSIDSKISYFESDLIPKANEAYNLAEQYYKSGSASFSELTSARSGLLELKIEAIELSTERALFLTDLFMITNVNIEIIK